MPHLAHDCGCDPDGTPDGRDGVWAELAASLATMLDFGFAADSDGLEISVLQGP